MELLLITALFLKKITLFEIKSIDLGNDFSPVSYLALNKMELTDKTQQEIDEGQLILAKLKQKAQEGLIIQLKENQELHIFQEEFSISETDMDDINKTIHVIILF